MRKNSSDLGIEPGDHREGSELAYPGPEVSPLSLVVEGAAADVAACAQALGLVAARV